MFWARGDNRNKVQIKLRCTFYMRLVSQVSWLNRPRADFQLLEQKESSLLLEHVAREPSCWCSQAGLTSLQVITPCTISWLVLLPRRSSSSRQGHMFLLFLRPLHGLTPLLTNNSLARKEQVPQDLRSTRSA